MSGIKDIVENKLVSIFETVGVYINSDDFDEIIQFRLWGTSKTSMEG